MQWPWSWSCREVWCKAMWKQGCCCCCSLLNVPATCECISGTDLRRQFYVLPHWDRSCRSNFPSHPVTVYWHRADQSQRWPYNARRLAGEPLECQCLSHWYDSTPKKSRRKQDSNPGLSALEADALPLGQRGGRRDREKETWGWKIIKLAVTRLDMDTECKDFWLFF